MSKKKMKNWIKLEPTKEMKKVLINNFSEPMIDKLIERMAFRLDYLRSNSLDDSDLSEYEMELVEDFVDIYSDIPEEIAVPSKYHQLATMILEYAKTCYEYLPDPDENPISDAVYDKLIAAYKKYGNVEPTGIVGGSAVSTGIEHPNLHNNLDKCYRIHESDEIPEGTAEKTSVEDWLRKVYDRLELSKSDSLKLMLAHKLDGVSVIADIDQNGRIVAAQSRGDDTKAMSMPGLVGLQVASATFTRNYKPFSIQYEMYCTHAQRDLAPQLVGLDREYKSNRSAVAAIRKRLETTNIPDIELAISLYPILGEGIVDESGPLENYEEIIDFIQNFARVPSDMHFPIFIEGSFNSLIDQIEEQFKQLTEIRENLSYPIDGMVITVADKDKQSIVGRDGRTNRFQIAMKFNPAYGDAVVDSIYLSSGNKGFRTIMVKLDHPVFIDGAEYTEVQVLSARQYDELGLDEGCQVRIHRTGDVIPKLTKLKDGNGKLIPIPDTCPSCGMKLIRDAQKMKCINPSCPENIAGRIRGFFNTLDIEGFSDAFASKLVEIGVNSPVKLLTLTQEELKSHDVTGKREDTFVSVVQDKIKSAKDYTMIAAMSLPGIGPSTSQKLVQNIGLDKLISLEYSALADMIRQIHGFNEKASAIAQTIIDYRAELDALRKYIDPKNITKVGTTTVMVGHTGTAVGPTLKYWIDKMEYGVTDGASFDMLLVADPETQSRKMKRAKKMNLPAMVEEDMISELKSRYFKKMGAYIASLPENITTTAIIKR